MADVLVFTGVYISPDCGTGEIVPDADTMQQYPITYFLVSKGIGNILPIAIGSRV